MNTEEKIIDWRYFYNHDYTYMDYYVTLEASLKLKRREIVNAKYMYAQFLMQIRKPTAELAKFLLCERENLDYMPTASGQVKILVWKYQQLPFEIKRLEDGESFLLPPWIENDGERLLIGSALLKLKESIEEREEIIEARSKDQQRESVAQWLSEKGY